MIVNGQRVMWLWRNGDHWLAYDNPYPTLPGSADPATLGEPEFVVTAIEGDPDTLRRLKSPQ